MAGVAQKANIRAHVVVTAQTEFALIAVKRGLKCPAVAHSESSNTGARLHEQLEQAVKLVRSWPPERQADVVHMVELMEEQDRSDLQLSDEDAAEVRRRLADPNPETISPKELFRRYTRTNR